MCNISEENSDGLFPRRHGVVVSSDAICKKCHVKDASVLLRRKDAYCQDCFLTAFTHKFRATLGKSKIVRPTDSVLVAHSGKAGSTALLHLIRAGMHESVHKRLVFQTTVLYIDDGALYCHTIEERKSMLEHIKNQVKNMNFIGFVTSLDQAFCESELKIQDIDSGDIQSSNDSVITRNFEMLSDMTSKEDFLCKLRHRLLIKSARKLGCNKIFLGDDCTSLATKILLNVSLGRAAHLSLDVGFVDTRDTGITMLRPMQNFTKQELFHYINHFKLDIRNSDNLTTEKQPTIRKITETFVTDLDSEFHGTVSTVFHVGEKLSSNSVNCHNKENICILCNAQLDTSLLPAEVSAMQATMFSQMISLNRYCDIYKNDSYQNVPSNSRCKMNNCGLECVENCDTKNEQLNIHLNDILTCLCYGCRLIFRNAKDVNNIPSFIKEAAFQSVCLEKMRLEINEFLL